MLLWKNAKIFCHFLWQTTKYLYCIIYTNRWAVTGDISYWTPFFSLHQVLTSKGAKIGINKKKYTLKRNKTKLSYYYYSETLTHNLHINRISSLTHLFLSSYLSRLFSMFRVHMSYHSTVTPHTDIASPAFPAVAKLFHLGLQLTRNKTTLWFLATNFFLSHFGCRGSSWKRCCHRWGCSSLQNLSYGFDIMAACCCMDWLS